jgi:hypothetical protein
MLRMIGTITAAMMLETTPAPTMEMTATMIGTTAVIETMAGMMTETIDKATATVETTTATMVGTTIAATTVATTRATMVAMTEATMVTMTEREG